MSNSENRPEKTPTTFSEFLEKMLNSPDVEERFTGTVSLIVDGSLITGELSTDVDYILSNAGMEHKDDDNTSLSLRKVAFRDILQSGNHVTDQVVLKNVTILIPPTSVEFAWWMVRISAISGWRLGGWINKNSPLG